ncbi:MAG TPA: hypothetical protein VHC70_00930 [Phycisphaerales bacterium]|nr:hypothetical protein [Phycisphaerales bacterium]
MPTDTAESPVAPSADYAALLAEARLAALRTLIDIATTSEDPTEKRLAATAILRAPEPKEPQSHARTAHEPAWPSPVHETHQTRPQPPRVPAPTIDPDELHRSIALARDRLARAGIPYEEQDDPDRLLEGVTPSAISELLHAAGRAPSG